MPASAKQSLIVYVQDRKPGDSLAAEMMRSQIRSGVARRRNSNLFSDWMTWNLSKQDFKPTRPLANDDADVGIESDDDAPAKQPEAKPAAKQPEAKPAATQPEAKPAAEK